MKSIKEIKDLIQRGNTSSALNELTKYEFEDNKYKNEIILLANRFDELQRSKRLGILSFSESDMENAKIINSILELIDKITFNSSTYNAESKSKQKIKMKDQADIVIVTALDIERNAVLSYLPNAEKHVTKNRIIYKAKLHDSNNDSIDVVVLSLPHMGNINAAIAVTQAIYVWNPRYVIMSGIAGGIKEDERNLGDVLVADFLLYYEYGKLKDDYFSNRFLTQQSSDILIQFAHNYDSENWIDELKVKPPFGTKRRPKVHFGVVATGEKVIAKKEKVDELVNVWPRLIGIEMEGYGSAVAAFQSENRPGFLMIKSICDWADSTKNDRWQEYAANTSASYTIGFLRSIINSHFNWKKDRTQAVTIEESEGGGFNGRMKICLCKDLLDEWEDLADYFDIPPNKQRRFKQGRECKDIWEWLQVRKKLGGLEEALKFLEREDLIPCLDKE